MLYIISTYFTSLTERSLCNVACSNYNCWNISSASNLFLPSWCWIILIKIISSERTIIDFCLSICFLLCPLFFPPNIFNRKEGFFPTCHWSEQFLQFSWIIVFCRRVSPSELEFFFLAVGLTNTRFKCPSAGDRLQ